MQSGARLSKPKQKVQEPVETEVKVEHVVVEPPNEPEPEVKPALPPEEPRIPKEKFTITRELPSLEEAPVQEKILAPAEPQMIEDKNFEKVEVELPAIDGLKDLKEEITDSERIPLKDRSFKVNFSMPRIGRPKLEMSESINSNRIMLVAIILVVTGIIGAITGLLYIESQPSTGKALNSARESLSNVQTMNFTLNSSFDLKSTPTDEAILGGAQEIDLVMTYKVTGKYDKVARKMDIDGEYQSIGESLSFKQTIIANETYIKYAGRDYIKGDLDDSILDIQSIEAQNLFPNLKDDTRFGFGAEEMIGTENTYRFRAYPSESLLNEHAFNFLSDIVRKLYPLNPPVIEASDMKVTNAGYRVWVGVNSYRPVKLQMIMEHIEIGLGDKGTIEITDYQTELLISSLNQSVIIDAPI